jgi:hypothetical protein
MYKTYGHTATNGVDYKTIMWNSDNASEMIQAEKSKLRLENKGYTFYGQDIGLFTTKMFYKKSV